MTASSPDITAEIKSLADRFEHLETTQDKTDALTYLAHIVQNPSDKPLETLPCANVDPARNWRCPEDGKLACSECRLVSYCSKTCQRTHWRVHKQDCKDPIRSANWEPAWVKERRDPSFVQLKESSEDWLSLVKEKEFALGLHLWGNIPAVDTLNLPKNEGVTAATSNLALAYVASGDLRNVIRTINELPVDYSGHLTILLNDREPMIVLRNILLLMILGTVGDITEVAEVALHFWYSAFLQSAHQLLLCRIILQLVENLDDGLFSLELGKHSILTGAISMRTKALLLMMGQSDLQIDDVINEIHRVKFEPSRMDRHHRAYCRLQPSHRLASLEFRRFCLVLPFGAANNNFNTANKSLFSPKGRWLQNDLATPLESWNIEDVVAAGKAHRAQDADLYGCLYFYLSDQLRSFSDRLKKFHISVRVFDQDARELAKVLRSGGLGLHGLPKSTCFDRIDVSNIIDSEYVGISNVLADWTPLLSKTNRCATILGYSMNWVPKQADSGPGPEAVKRLADQLIHMGKLGLTTKPSLFPALWKYFVAIYDNSDAFSKYLEKQGTEDAARKAGIKLKSKHTIVPHRICAPLHGLPNALPVFPTEESWYLNVQVGGAMFSERFVEFSRV